MPDLNQHYRAAINAMLEGRLVPFLGAGVNLCGRPEKSSYAPNQRSFLPSGGELARCLAERSAGSEFLKKSDLAHVAEYVALTEGSYVLYQELHKIFDADYPPTTFHTFLATLHSTLQSKGYSTPNPMIITTNYDDLMERAFKDAGEKFDVVFYVADGPQKGRFVHRDPEGNEQIIDKPNEYDKFALEQRPVILKIHGAVKRAAVDPEEDSYVITEDHYIDYLTRTDPSLVPVTLRAAMRRSSFLFLGYALRDWNLRVILHRLFGERKLDTKSWSVQTPVDHVDEEFWKKRGVECIDMDLRAYLDELCARVGELAAVAGR